MYTICMVHNLECKLSSLADWVGEAQNPRLPKRILENLDRESYGPRKGLRKLTHNDGFPMSERERDYEKKKAPVGNLFIEMQTLEIFLKSETDSNSNYTNF